ncbi:hypothetical protein KBD87_02270 [Candidatus Saccharibacteria bacterium]|nr:hypothetical protein [Candidatus Saccharibacteria bacterium]
MRRRSLVIAVFITAALITSVVVFMLLSGSKQTELERTIGKIEHHIVLPKGEEPALITVVDDKKLSSVYLKEFAKTGDKVLLYQNAKRIIVYRPSIDKIVDMNILQIDDVSTVKQQEKE